MNAIEYEQYEKDVATFMERNNVKAGCFSRDEDDDSYFSWQPCECCQRSQGGTRFDYSFAQNDGAQFEAAICVDCEYYLTYGRLDDMTMLEIAETKGQP